MKVCMFKFKFDTDIEARHVPLWKFHGPDFPWALISTSVEDPFLIFVVRMPNPQNSTTQTFISKSIRSNCIKSVGESIPINRACPLPPSKRQQSYLPKRHPVPPEDCPSWHPLPEGHLGSPSSVPIFPKMGLNYLSVLSNHNPCTTSIAVILLWGHASNSPSLALRKNLPLV